MIVRVNIALRNALLDALFNGGSISALLDSATIQFRTGSQPALADDAATGIVVATMTLPADAMNAASGGACAKSATTWEDASADADGTIGYARFTKGSFVMDLDVTDNAGSGAIRVDDPILVETQQFIITAFTMTWPAST